MREEGEREREKEQTTKKNGIFSFSCSINQARKTRIF